jgi:hypothetical protein
MNYMRTFQTLRRYGGATAGSAIEEAKRKKPG